MKTKNIFKGAFFASIIALLITACEKDDDNNNNAREYNISGDASGAQQNPAVASAGTATLTGTYHSGTNRLDYTINWSSLSDSAIAAHFHGPAAAGENAGPVIDISDEITFNGVSGTISGNTIVADSVERFLLDGRIYYNIHTAAWPDGEIRGQVITTPKN